MYLMFLSVRVATRGGQQAPSGAPGAQMSFKIHKIPINSAGLCWVLYESFTNLLLKVPNSLKEQISK